MAFEFFYPKEMRKAISDLRVEDDLNERALKTLDKQILVLITLTVFTCSFFIIFAGFEGLFVSSLLVGGVFLLGSLFIKHIFYKNMAAYIWGEETQGVVRKIYFKNPRFPTKVIVVENSSTGEIVKMAPGSIWSRRRCHDSPEIGDVVCYYDKIGDDRIAPMPSLYGIKSIFSLSKSLLKAKGN